MCKQEEVKLDPKEYGLASAKQYDRAMSLIAYYVQLTWLVFGAFLVSETVLLAALTSGIVNGGNSLFIFGGAFLGLILVIPWWSSFKYNHTLYLLRIYEARMHEPEEAVFFINGEKIINGAFFKDYKNKEISMPWLARALHPSKSVAFLIICFGCMFTCIMIASILPWIKIFFETIKVFFFDLIASI